jgi:2-oxoglutarate dehydrogenase E2 component (dihydrolipoamide succinyltransferase)
MPTEVRVPTLGESVVDAVVGAWLKKEGDAVASGETLVELETDKVNVEVIAQDAGVLEKIMKQEGETVNVGEVIAAIDENATAQAEKAEQPTAQAAPAAAAAPAPAVEAPASAPQAEPAEMAGGVRATPGVRRLAAEYDLDLSKVPASGESGRVTREDVLRYALNRPSAEPAPAAPAAAPTNGATQAPIPPATPTAPATTPAPAPFDEALGRREERVRMSRRRQTIAQRLVEAQHTAAMLTTFNEVDMSAIMDIRKRRRDAFKEQHGVGLGFMSFFTKAVVAALKAFPRLNAEIRGEEIVLKRYYDIGIAVAAEEGLVVPVVRDADRKGFAELEREIGDLAERARSNRLTLEQLRGGTFTITNGGVFGSLLSTPILSPPQVGILGMHRIQERPVALNGEVVIRSMMYLALTYDHRLIDGSEAVQFLVRIKDLIEDPEGLLLDS